MLLGLSILYQDDDGGYDPTYAKHVRVAEAPPVVAPEDISPLVAAIAGVSPALAVAVIFHARRGKP